MLVLIGLIFGLVVDLFRSRASSNDTAPQTPFGQVAEDLSLRAFAPQNIELV